MNVAFRNRGQARPTTISELCKTRLFETRCTVSIVLLSIILNKQPQNIIVSIVSMIYYKKALVLLANTAKCIHFIDDKRMSENHPFTAFNNNGFSNTIIENLSQTISSLSSSSASIHFSRKSKCNVYVVIVVMDPCGPRTVALIYSPVRGIWLIRSMRSHCIIEH